MENTNENIRENTNEMSENIEKPMSRGRTLSIINNKKYNRKEKKPRSRSEERGVPIGNHAKGFCTHCNPGLSIRIERSRDAKRQAECDDFPVN